MNKATTNQHSKALLVLAGVILLFITLILLPYLAALDSNKEQIHDLQFKLQKYLDTAKQANALKQQLADMETRNISQEDLLSGDSSAIAGANLQELVSQRIKNFSGQLESTRIVSIADENSLQRITIQSQFNSDLQALQRILYSVEFEKPLLYIDKINIRAQQKNQLHRQQRQDLLNVTIDISGYRFSGEAES